LTDLDQLDDLCCCYGDNDHCRTAIAKAES
jgi:hypothetical protein